MSENLDDKVASYESFVNDRLKVDLKKVLDLRDKVYEEIGEYMQVKSTIEKLQLSEVTTNLKTQMDIGCSFYVQAVIPNPTRICVKIGYGFFVEFTFPEALAFIDKKFAALNITVDRYSKEASSIKAKIKVVLEGLRELQNIDQDVSKRRPDYF